jgi:hypothetical protein
VCIHVVGAAGLFSFCHCILFFVVVCFFLPTATRNHLAFRERRMALANAGWQLDKGQGEEVFGLPNLPALSWAQQDFFLEWSGIASGDAFDAFHWNMQKCSLETAALLCHAHPRLLPVLKQMDVVELVSFMSISSGTSLRRCITDFLFMVDPSILGRCLIMWPGTRSWATGGPLSVFCAS